MSEVRLLGAVQLWDASGPVPAGPPQQRCVLAVLALTPSRSVSQATLIDRVWNGRLPRDPRNALYTTVSRLRHAVAPLGGTIRHDGNGYRLDIDPDRVDLHRVRRLVVQAQELVGRGSTEVVRAASLLAEACAGWRGTPLGGIKGEWVDRIRAALEQERLATLIAWFEAELACGRDREALGSLAAAHAEYPLAEPLAGLLMRALYRTGRQVEALDVFARVRRQLIDEIGDEPGEALRELHALILRRDPSLVARTVESGLPGPEPPVPAQLPADIPAFTGRANELRQLDALPTRAGPPVLAFAVIDGPPGMGKTALAVHWAHRARGRFPDGQLYVDLRGYAANAAARPVEVLASFLRALGVPRKDVPDEVGEAVETYRSLTADKQILVILDNAASAEQVRPLLPGGGRCMVLVTSRDQLSGLVAREGARRIGLGTLSPAESVTLLAELVSPDQAAAGRSAFAELAGLCGHLPLALRIAAANVAASPQRTVFEQVLRLRADDRLAGLSLPGDPQTAVRTTFELSYTRRSGPARRLFRLLGLVPGADFTEEVAASLIDSTSRRAGMLLEELADAHLLERRAVRRYAFHDLLRHYATDRAEQEETSADRAAAVERLYSHYLSTSDSASKLLHPSVVRLSRPDTKAHASGPTQFAGPEQALAWLDDERHNLVACVTRAAATGPLHVAWHLADALRGYVYLRSCVVEGLAIARAGLAAAEASGDRRAQAAVLLNLASLADIRGRYDECIGVASRSLDLARQVGWVDGQGSAARAVGVASWHLGRPMVAISHHREALACYASTGWRAGQAVVANSLGVVYTDLGDLRRAAAFTERALRLNRSIGSAVGEAANRVTLGDIYRYQGAYGRALSSFTEARAMFGTVGDRYGVGDSLRGLATVHRDLGNLSQARELVEQALAVQRETGHRRLAVDLRVTLASIRALADDPAADDYQGAADLARDGGNRFLEAEALIGLGSVQWRLGMLLEAHQRVSQALAIAREAAFRLLEGQARTVLAAVELDLDNLEKATEQARRGLSLLRRTGHQPGEARAHLVLSWAAQTAGRPERAWRHEHAAQEIFATLGVPEGIRRTAFFTR